MYQMVNCSATADSAAGLSQFSEGTSPAALFAFVHQVAGTCLPEHVEMRLMLGVILYLYVFHKGPRAGRGQRYAGKIQFGGVCLSVLIELALGFEAALLPVSFMGTLLYFTWYRGTVQPIKEKTATESHAQTAQSSSVTPPAESIVMSHDDFTLEAQAKDIVRGLTPLRCDEAAARKVAVLTKRCITGVIPEAEVHAIPIGNAAVLTARGAQPQVDVVVTVPPDTLTERLHAYYAARRSPKHKDTVGNLSMLHKAATRTLSELLTFARFWRSQLTSSECKVIMLVPTSMRVCHHVIYIHLYVNAQFPLRMQTLVSEACLRRKKLLLVVTHWASQRCIMNVQRGLFAKYAWAALVWYFCTVKPQEYKQAHNIIDSFRRFVNFYADWFRHEMQPSVCFSRKVIIPPDKGLLRLPYIEDYLEAGSDLAEGTTVDGFTRVKAELQRAQEMLSSTGGKVVGDLFEQWTFDS